MVKEVKIERGGYGFEVENPIYVANNLDLYRLLQGFRLNVDSDGNVVHNSLLQNVLPVEDNSTNEIKCFRFYFPVNLEKTELYDLYFCINPNKSPEKGILNIEVSSGLKLKVSEESAVVAQGQNRYKTEQQEKEDRLRFQNYLSSIRGEVDKLFPQALAECILAGQASATLLRRRFEIGYPKAAILIDQMENAGFISGPQGLAGRDVYISREEYKNLFGHEPKSITEKVENKRKSMSEDEILKDTLRLIFEEGFIPTASGLRRKYDISYPKAARVIDKMEDSGYISKQEGCGPRQVLITKDEYLKLIKEGK